MQLLLSDFVRAAKLAMDVPSQCVQRSIQDLVSTTLLVARSPVYVGDPVDVLVLTRTFWIGLDYHVTFNDDDEPRRISELTALSNDSFPVWLIHGEFVSSVEFDNGAQLSSTEGLVWVALTHHYASAGIYAVQLIVSGQLTLNGPIQQAEVAVRVLVRDWPSLRDVMGHVTLASQSQPAYVNESVKFVYAVEKVVENVKYWIHLGTDLQTTVREISLMSIFSVSVDYRQIAGQCRNFHNSI